MTSMNPNPKQRDIWLVNFDPTLGHEIKKSRPAVVVSSKVMQFSNLRLVIPIRHFSTRHENYDWMLRIYPDKINNLKKESTIDCIHLRSVAIERFIKPIGSIDQLFFNDIKGIINLII